jgi:hypothetical protein
MFGLVKLMEPFFFFSSSLIILRLHTKTQLSIMPGSNSKVWVVGVESKCCDQLWPSRTMLNICIVVVVQYN